MRRGDFGLTKTIIAPHSELKGNQITDSSPHLEELHGGGGGVDEHDAQAASSFQPIVGAIPADEREHQRQHTTKYAKIESTLFFIFYIVMFYIEPPTPPID